MTEPLSHAHNCQMLLCKRAVWALKTWDFESRLVRCSHPVSIRDWIALELMQYSEYEGISPERLAGANPCGDVQREGLSKSWRGFHWRTGPGGG